IIDVYDAITTRRCYAGSMNPFAALKDKGIAGRSNVEQGIKKEKPRYSKFLVHYSTYLSASGLSGLGEDSLRISTTKDN
ncbi:MAG: hypothetical protein V3V47_02500, partial [Desulfobacteria bacterium]